MSNEKILIVDDEKEMCLLVKSFLDNEQFQTYTAYDATSALELLESVEPDLDPSGYHASRYQRCRSLPADPK